MQIRDLSERQKLLGLLGLKSQKTMYTLDKGKITDDPPKIHLLSRVMGRSL